MKIAFVSTILTHAWGGADTLWTRAAEAAATRGDQLLFSISPLTARHPRIATLVTEGAELHLRHPQPDIVPLGQRLMRKFRLTASSDAELISKLECFQPDLVIFSQGGTYDLIIHPGLAAWLCARRIKFRIIANWQAEHPNLNPDGQRFIDATFAAADMLCFVSTRNLSTTHRHLLSLLPNAQVLHNPLRWQPEDASPWPASTGVVRLATVSRLDEGKGIHLLLHALAESQGRLPAWRLEIFGQGSMESRLHATIAYLGLRDQVTLRGQVADLHSIWADNELLCSPAIDDGVPMTIPEAMLCGRPVLATRVGGAEDWIDHDHTGFLCPAATVPLLSSVLVEALAKHTRWPLLGQAARETTIERYRPDDYLSLIG